MTSQGKVASILVAVTAFLLAIVISITKGNIEATTRGGKAIALILALVFYFIPSIIAAKKAKAASIFLLNLLLGWTIVGWAVALVWAIKKEPPATPQTAP